MSNEQPPKGFITPPPGLLPERPHEPLEGTDSHTRRVQHAAPVFFARPPGAPGVDAPSGPDAEESPAAAAPVAPADAAPGAATLSTATPNVATPNASTPKVADTVIVARGDAASSAVPAAAPSPDRTASWALRTAEGVEHPIPPSGVIVGRNPARPDGWENASVVGVFDPEKSVSKTHAALRLEGGELYVHDLSSTNGTTVAFPDGTDVRVRGDAGTAVPSGSTIGLGSYPMLAIRS